jgi:hypothetical protein
LHLRSPWVRAQRGTSAGGKGNYLRRHADDCRRLLRTRGSSAPLATVVGWAWGVVALALGDAPSRPHVAHHVLYDAPLHAKINVHHQAAGSTSRSAQSQRFIIVHNLNALPAHL